MLSTLQSAFQKYVYVKVWMLNADVMNKWRTILHACCQEKLVRHSTYGMLRHSTTTYKIAGRRLCSRRDEDSSRISLRQKQRCPLLDVVLATMCWFVMEQTSMRTTPSARGRTRTRTSRGLQQIAVSDLRCEIILAIEGDYACWICLETRSRT